MHLSFSAMALGSILCLECMGANGLVPSASMSILNHKHVEMSLLACDRQLALTFINHMVTDHRDEEFVIDAGF